MLSAVRPIAARAAAVLGQRPAGILTDIDGTISPIVPRPEDAVVSASVRDSLEALAASLDVVAVITARAAATAREMVGASTVTYVGHYGLEAAHDGNEAALLAGARDEAAHLLLDLPCVYLEDKGLSFALHYRNCAGGDEVRRRLLEGLVPVAARYGARVLEGKKVIELVPGSVPDKRAAAIGLCERHRLHGVVYLGDDLSDVAVFEEIRQRREAGLPGLAVAVADAETDARVLAAADVGLPGVSAAEELLASLATTLARKESRRA